MSSAASAPVQPSRGERGGRPAARPGPVLVAAACLLLAGSAWGQSVVVVPGKEGLPADPPELTLLPFAFASGSFGIGLGGAGLYSNWPDRESSLMGAVAVGTKGSYNLSLLGSQWRTPFSERLYIEPLVMVGRYRDQYLYVGTQNTGFVGERAGANDSDPSNRIDATQWDNRAELEFRYLLPFGHGRDEPIVNTYVVDQGLLLSGATGGDSWNPLESGRTYVTVTPGWRRQTSRNDTLDVPLETRNVQVAIEHDNRDFPANPSRGGFQRLSWKKDFGDEGALSHWEAWEADLAWHFDLGDSESTRQQVLALDMWSAYVPTWETDATGAVTSRPPQYEGANLGGFFRMRGFEQERFHDKAAIYYSAEYRVIPDWQPMQDVELLKASKPRYWQWAVFLEAGQVAPSWSLGDLHDDLHFDTGVSLRGMFHHAVGRLDIAVSEEGTRAVAMFGHPF